MKKILISLGLVSLLLQTSVHANQTKNIFDLNTSKGTSVIMSNSALKSYMEKYKKAKLHKAFAQSEGGAWSWKTNMTTREYAIKAALMQYQKKNKKYEKNYKS